MRKNSVGCVVVLVLILCALWAPVRGDASEIEDRVADVAERLDAYTAEEFATIPRTTGAQMVQDFRDGLVVLTAGAAQVEDRALRNRLVVRLSRSLGSFYERVTEPFVDVSATTPTMEDLSDRYPGNRRITNAFVWAGSRLMAGLSGVGRDLVRLPKLATDTRRSKAAAEMVDALREKIFRQIDDHREESDYALAGLRRVTDEMLTAEPSTNRRTNSAARWVFRAFALASLFHPLIVIFPNYSYWAPLMSSVFWSGMGMSLALARTLDSGLGAADRLEHTVRELEGQKADPETRRRWQSCKDLLRNAA